MFMAGLIGLGALSLGYSLYRQNKSDKQVDTANANNRYAAELSYQATQDTNKMNYDIFQQQLQYYSPQNMKSMYDQLGLNGSAIVANQGFSPVAAPQMQAPQMQQTPYQQYDSNVSLSGADRFMKSLLDGLATEKVKAEIDEIGKRAIKTEAETAQCRQSTQNLILDHALKGFNVEGARLENILKQNDVDMLSETNAQLRLSVRSLQQTIDMNDKLMPYILRQYDDKHALEAADTIIKQLDAKYHEEEIKLSLKKMFEDIQTAIKTHRMQDIEYTIATYTEEIARKTKDSRIDSENAENKRKKNIAENTTDSDIMTILAENQAKQDKALSSSMSERQEQKKYEAMSPEAWDSFLDRHMAKFVSDFNVLVSAFLSPLSSLLKAFK